MQFVLSCTFPQPQSRSSPRFVTGFLPLPLLPFVVDGAHPFTLPRFLPFAVSVSTPPHLILHVCPYLRHRVSGATHLPRHGSAGLHLCSNIHLVELTWFPF